LPWQLGHFQAAKHGLDFVRALADDIFNPFPSAPPASFPILLVQPLNARLFVVQSHLLWLVRLDASLADVSLLF
jgi:hypothetical protein